MEKAMMTFILFSTLCVLVLASTLSDNVLATKITEDMRLMEGQNPQKDQTQSNNVTALILVSGLAMVCMVGAELLRK